MNKKDSADIIRQYLKEKPLLLPNIKRTIITILYQNKIYKNALQNIKKCSFHDPVKTIHIIKILAHEALLWRD